MSCTLDSNLVFLGEVEPDNLAYLAGILFGGAASGKANDWQALASGVTRLGASYQELVDGVVEKVGLTAAVKGKDIAEKEQAVVELLRRPILRQMAIFDLDKMTADIPEDMSDKDANELCSYRMSSKMEKDSKTFSMEEFQLVLKDAFGDDTRMEMLLQMAESEQKQLGKKKGELPEPFIPALRMPDPNIGKIVQAVVEIARLRKFVA
ncbi:MAG: hypothetical protein IK012_02555 [Fibrobacter sp.]|uniref:hypothetical protein n=1 Tax=Fibrobacter sp. TaxID=35828 RepID=UPI0025C16ED2|nr:hypothetical protein [Fibrobacter sp.]MBR4784118.1 hypothetical protein [Fibrobacter sp.]